MKTTIGNLTDIDLVDTLYRLEARAAFRQCLTAMIMGMEPDAPDVAEAEDELSKLVHYEPGDVIEGYDDLKLEAEIRGLMWESGELAGLGHGMAFYDELVS